MGIARQLERAGLALQRAGLRLSAMRHQSEQAIASESQLYWSDSSSDHHRSQSHWRGAGPFVDDDLWLGLGRLHRSLFERAADWVRLELPVARILEWGCGGGMNAVPLASLTSEYCGVDISSESLDECQRQLAALGADNFVPIRIESESPEAVHELVQGPCDLFLSTYVFELIPTPEYGLRLMQIAFDLLGPNGVALVQIRYHTGSLGERSRRRNYSSDPAQMTTYAVDEFWSDCQGIGFTPLFVHLMPRQPELSESRYAYFAMRK